MVREVCWATCAVALALIVSMKNVSAQTWTKEPRAVLGVALGRPLNESSVPRCEAGTTLPTDICLSKDSGLAEAPARFTIERHPFPYADLTVVVDEAGIVSAVVAIMSSEKFGEFAATLVERYGAPTSKTNEAWQAKSGAVFQSQALSWRGKVVTILAMERGHRVDRAVVAFNDNEAARRAEAAAKAKTQGAASKL